LVTAIHVEILFEGLVETFGLSISFQVVAEGVVNLHVQGLAQTTEEVRDEFRAPITGDMCGNSVFGEDMDDE
jgi:hypothetical protein